MENKSENVLDERKEYECGFGGCGFGQDLVEGFFQEIYEDVKDRLGRVLQNVGNYSAVFNAGMTLGHATLHYSFPDEGQSVNGMILHGALTAGSLIVAGAGYLLRRGASSLESELGVDSERV